MRLFPLHPARSMALWSLLGIVLLALWVNQPPKSEASPATAEQLTRELEHTRDYVVVLERLTRIMRELETLGPHAWAGVYEGKHVVTDAGERELLAIAPREGFVWTYGWSRIPNRFAWGDVVGTDVESVHVRVNSDAGVDPTAHDRAIELSFPSELVPVSWGARRYLVPANRIIDICNSYNSGRSHMYGIFPLLGGGLREEEWDRPDGVPALPARYRAWLLEQPISVHVTATGEPKVLDAWSDGTHVVYGNTALVDAGSAEGLVNGMVLFVESSWSQSRVTDVFDHSARIRFDFCGVPEDRWLDHEYDPRVGARLSTSCNK
jgi:hypothetical protein